MKVLCLAPHPDDEAYGCGGTLFDHQTRGDEIHIIYLTSGEKVDPHHVREQEAAAVCAKLGATPHFWREPDGGVVVHERLTGKLRQFVADNGVELVYAPHAHERHDDHVAAYGIVFWGLMGTEIETRHYEIWTPLRHVKTVVNVEPYRLVKLDLIHTYLSQHIFPNYLDDAITGLNRYRAVVEGHQEFYLGEAFG